MSPGNDDPGGWLLRSAGRALDAARSLKGVGRWVDAVHEGELAGTRLRVRYLGRAQRLGDSPPLCLGHHAPGPWTCVSQREVGAVSALLGESGAARGADTDVLVLDELLAGKVSSNDAVRFSPYVHAVLPIQKSVDAQIAAVRSKSYRRVLRQALGQGREIRVSRERADLDRFYDEMYRLTAEHRFGGRAHIVPREEILRFFDGREACLIFVAEGGRTLGGALCYSARRFPGRLFVWKNGFVEADTLDPKTRRERTAALEASLIAHAVEASYTSLDLGLTSPVPSDGIFVHKRRLGCFFEPLLDAPRFLLEVRPHLQAAFFGRLPLLVGEAGDLTCLCGDAGDEGAALRLEELLREISSPGLRRVRLYGRGERMAGVVAHAPEELTVEWVKAEGGKEEP